MEYYNKYNKQDEILIDFSIFINSEYLFRKLNIALIITHLSRSTVYSKLGYNSIYRTNELKGKADQVLKYL